MRYITREGVDTA